MQIEKLIVKMAEDPGLDPKDCQHLEGVFQSIISRLAPSEFFEFSLLYLQVPEPL